MKRILSMVVVACIAALLFSSCSTTKPTVRKPVDAVAGSLTLHPVFTDIKTKNDQFFFFLDASTKTLFMTNDTTVFDDVIDYLPVKIVPGRSVLLEGTFINPFTEFTKEQFAELTSKVAKLGVELNEWRVARIFNYGIKEGGNGTSNDRQNNDGKKMRNGTKRSASTLFN